MNQNFPKTFFGRHNFGSLIALVSCVFSVVTSSSVSAQEKISVSKRPVLSVIRGMPTPITPSDIAANNIWKTIQEGIEDKLYPNTQSRPVLINPTDEPDQIAAKTAVKLITSNLSFCNDQLVVSLANPSGFLKAEGLKLGVKLDRFMPSEVQLRNGELFSSTYAVHVEFEVARTFLFTNSTWQPWGDKMDCGYVMIKIQELSGHDRFIGVPPYVVQTTNLLTCRSVDCSQIPPEPSEITKPTLAERIAHLEPKYQIKILSDLTELHDNEATGLLAERYINGVGISRDASKAVPLLERVAPKDPSAWRRLAKLFWTGELGKAEKLKAMTYLELSAKAGDMLSIRDYALCLQKGVGNQPDIIQARKLWEYAAIKGDVRAQHLLGLCYLEDEPQNFEKAIYWLESASKTDAWAEFPAGVAYAYIIKETYPKVWEEITSYKNLLYYKEGGSTPDPMLEHFRKAAAMGDARSFAYIALFGAGKFTYDSARHAEAASYFPRDSRLQGDYKLNYLRQVFRDLARQNQKSEAMQLVNLVKPMPSISELSFEPPLTNTVENMFGKPAQPVLLPADEDAKRWIAESPTNRPMTRTEPSLVNTLSAGSSPHSLSNSPPIRVPRRRTSSFR